MAAAPTAAQRMAPSQARSVRAALAAVCALALCLGFLASQRSDVASAVGARAGGEAAAGWGPWRRLLAAGGGIDEGSLDAASFPSGPATHVEELANRPRGDKRKYQYAELPNGLRVLNIQDSGTLRAAAGIAVRAGSYDDPLELPGLAHFCEHMLFLGTKRFPDPSGFDDFVSKHGGDDNAYTANEVTVYHGEVAQAVAFQQLQRLSDFFREPLFHDDFVQKEVHAINSEHLKNMQDVARRVLETMNSLADEGSPVSRFHTGNLETLYLAPQRNRTSPVTGLKEYFRTQYCPSRMTIATLSAQPLGKQLEDVEATFGRIPAGSEECRNRSVRTFEQPPPFPPSRMGKWLTIEGTEPESSLWIQWQTRDLTAEYASQPLEYIDHLLSYDGADSFVRVLTDSLGLATHVSSLADMSSAGTSLYLVVYLTDLGREHLELVFDVLYAYVANLQHKGVDQKLYSTISEVNRLEWDWGAPGGPGDTVQDFAERMTRLPPGHLLTGDSLVLRKNPELVEHILSRLTPDNMNIALVDQNAEKLGLFRSHEERTLPNWGVKYSLAEIQEALPEAWQRWQGWQSQRDEARVRAALHEAVVRAGIIPAAAEYPVAPGPILGVPKDIKLKDMHAKVLAADVAAVERWAALYGQPPQELQVKLPERFTLDPQVYYRSGWVTQSPKVMMQVMFRPVRPHGWAELSVVDGVRLALYSRLLSEEMEPKMVDLTLAGATYSVAVSYLSGLIFDFTGFAPVLLRLVGTVFGEVNSFNGNLSLTRPSRFARIVQEFRKSFESYTKMPVMYALADRNLVLEAGEHSRAESAEALSGISLEAAASAASDLLLSRRLQLTALAMGNIAEEKSQHLIEHLAKYLRIPEGLQVEEHGEVQYRAPIVRISKPVEIRMLNPRPNDPNDVTVVTLYNGVGTVESQVLLGLLGRILRFIAFTELRSVRQLGYVVEAGYGAVSNVDYLSVMVQGTALGADDVEQAIEAVLAQQMVQHLKNLTEHELNGYKEAAMESFEEPPVSPSSEVSHFWGPVSLGGQCFEFTSQIMKYLNSSLVSKAKLIQTYSDLVLLGTGSRRKMTVKYFANEVPPRLGDLDVSRSMEKQGVPNEAIFRLVSERSSTRVFDRADSSVRQQLAKEGGYYPTDLHCRLSVETLHELELAALPADQVPSPGLSRSSLLAALGKRASQVARTMHTEDVVSTLRSFAMLGEKPDVDLMEALGGRVTEAAPQMGMQELAEVLNAYGALGSVPTAPAFAAVGARIAQVAGQMNAQNISSVINGYAVLEQLPELPLAHALEQRIQQVAADMSPSDIAAVLAAYAKLWRMRLSRLQGEDRSRGYEALLEQLPGESVMGALCRRAEEAAPGMAASEAVLVLKAYAVVWSMVHEALTTRSLFDTVGEYQAMKLKLQQMASLGSEMLGALGLRLQTVAQNMRPVDVANVFEAFAKLGQTPDGRTLQALALRLQQVVQLMNTDDVARTFAAYSKLRDMQLRAETE